MADSTSYRRPVITLEDAAFRVRDRLILPGTSWEIKTGQNWVVVGPNGVGKTTLVRALAGEVPVVAGRIRRHHPGTAVQAVGYVSFERHRDFIAREDDRDSAREFSGDFSTHTTVGALIRELYPRYAGGRAQLDRIAGPLGIDHLWHRPIRHLSTGEMRKVLIARALAKNPRLLVLDEPFDGLDPGARIRLHHDLNALLGGPLQIVLVVHRDDEILNGITHLLRIGADGSIVAQTRDAASGHKALRVTEKWPDLPPDTMPLPDQWPPKLVPGTGGEQLVVMKNVTVRYGDAVALQPMDWVVKSGENWAVVGPNGSGKTTLLRLIYADLPQAYANEIHLFGRRRGTGESIWEIRRAIGVVGAEYQLRYRRPLTGFEVILSGFFDTVGLYRTADTQQRHKARQWIDVLGIRDLSERVFTRLSYGEQRMILIARALVKSPRLLLLDEPCQGLDPENRQRVLSVIDWIGHHSSAQIVYVTHHPDEILSCITHVLDMEKGKISRSEETGRVHGSSRLAGSGQGPGYADPFSAR